MARQQGQPKYDFGWPDGRLGGLGPAGSMTPDITFMTINVTKANDEDEMK